MGLINRVFGGRSRALRPGARSSERAVGRPGERAGGGSSAREGGGSGRRAGATGRRTVLILVGMVSLSLTIAALFGERGLLELVRYRSERTRLLGEIALLEAQVKTLEAEVESLANDPIAMERLAREELGLAHPGEILVFLDTESSRDPRLSQGWSSPLPSN